jgi:hypothetical protein
MCLPLPAGSWSEGMYLFVSVVARVANWLHVVNKVTSTQNALGMILAGFI